LARPDRHILSPVDSLRPHGIGVNGVTVSAVESVEPLEPLLDRRMGCVTLQRRSGIAGGLEATENSPGGVKDAAGMGGAMAEG